MAILRAYTVPHPPIIIPAVGKGSEQQIITTTTAYEQVALEIASLQPDTIILTSPHAVMYADYFHISPGEEATGDFAAFHLPQVQIKTFYDAELVEAIDQLAKKHTISAGILGEKEPALDHGTMVPLYFINQKYVNYKLVRIGLSGLPLEAHYRLGQLITHAVDQLHRRVVFIASGDLSHRLKTDGPYGFNPSGPAYDKKIMDVLRTGNFLKLLQFSDKLCQDAAECGHRSFTIMAGALDRQSVKAQQLSYEGPFGVGYGICSFTPTGADSTRDFGAQYKVLQQSAVKIRREQEDPYVRLARQALETYIRTGQHVPIPAALPAEMQHPAGAFISLKKHGRLRGCIGTIGPTKPSVAAEIIGNAISAATADPRFSPVRPDELDELMYSVDILGPIELIDSPDQLDIKRYGVIVTKENRRGLLLPNLESIDTIADQIAIAKEKAGIQQSETVRLERFEVVRHF